MKELFELVESVAASDANILIQGENGTGKELIANAIHYNSQPRRRAVHQDQLRGDPEGPDRERAVRLQEGRVHRARRPTRSACSRWRRAARCCSTRSARCRRTCRRSCCACCRSASTARSAAIASSRRLPADLRDQHRPRRRAARRKLREDLYFRINTITLRVPPLRERTEDIPLLCNHFLEKFNQRYQKNVRSSRRRRITC